MSAKRKSRRLPPLPSSHTVAASEPGAVEESALIDVAPLALNLILDAVLWPRAAAGHRHAPNSSTSGEYSFSAAHKGVIVPMLAAAAGNVIAEDASAPTAAIAALGAEAFTDAIVAAARRCLAGNSILGTDSSPAAPGARKLARALLRRYDPERGEADDNDEDVGGDEEPPAQAHEPVAVVRFLASLVCDLGAEIPALSWLVDELVVALAVPAAAAFAAAAPSLLPAVAWDAPFAVLDAVTSLVSGLLRSQESLLPHALKLLHAAHARARLVLGDAVRAAAAALPLTALPSLTTLVVTTAAAVRLADADGAGSKRDPASALVRAWLDLVAALAAPLTEYLALQLAPPAGRISPLGSAAAALVHVSVLVRSLAAAAGANLQPLEIRVVVAALDAALDAALADGLLALDPSHPAAAAHDGCDVLLAAAALESAMANAKADAESALAHDARASAEWAALAAVEEQRASTWRETLPHLLAPLLHVWIEATRAQIAEWTTSALLADTLTPVDPGGQVTTSSSFIDLWCLVDQALAPLRKHARLVTSSVQRDLAALIHDALVGYVNAMARAVVPAAAPHDAAHAYADAPREWMVGCLDVAVARARHAKASGRKAKKAAAAAAAAASNIGADAVALATGPAALAHAAGGDDAIALLPGMVALLDESLPAIVALNNIDGSRSKLNELAAMALEATLGELAPLRRRAMRVAAWPCAQALCALVGVGLGDERVAPATLARAGCSILDAHLEAWVDAARARVFDGLLAATWVSVNAVLYAVLVPGGRDGRAGRGIAVDAEVLGAVCALRDAAEDLFHASGEGLGVGRLRRASALVGSLVELHQLDSDTLVASYHSLAETEALAAAAGTGAPICCA
ncbi:uncharacterized protein AMSG_08435 [Thecamonas trahens ATCC 50062]|uniref:MHD2 domain-containing protein n=1 Tax=Thecamonas trahens ATCC 50062 TaxID=461836 RepID=A0A0L0DK64_THETB|nr:hypothetical protein AMSG_08435 [Thecamonas trahens ATCC 50062]KNC52451.1 hypothetical protein AMSG_08435 [Thecamonas trahens ATCC 50062]|eukprot:XP_013755491.1 hypothetical protein AMSG_08435 [Thecamonas trahens ATCC 50062]